MPPLSWTQPLATVEAVCPSGKHVLKGGLGSLGVGIMWLDASGEDTKGVKVEACGGFGCGVQARERREPGWWPGCEVDGSEGEDPDRDR